uniref:Uncharacterized protein n=1 Tax=Oryza sativa subsp. japonica TaxID=39947 RepID=Q6ZCB1_ORYSJ|nr:hypothetical protein [Oryza sativa Japonica Group]
MGGGSVLALGAKQNDGIEGSGLWWWIRCAGAAQRRWLAEKKRRGGKGRGGHSSALLTPFSHLARPKSDVLG